MHMGRPFNFQRFAATLLRQFSTGFYKMVL